LASTFARFAVERLARSVSAKRSSTPFSNAFHDGFMHIALAANRGRIAKLARQGAASLPPALLCRQAGNSRSHGHAAGAGS
jgi:hypothetical protein